MRKGSTEREAGRHPECQAGGLFLEAPVSGSKGPAEQGKLIFLTGGKSGKRESEGGDKHGAAIQS